jgi:nicotinate-nucleotide pyrophosphorylase (carboxylating)
MDDISRFLAEDLNKEGDITSDALFTNEHAQGVIIVKEPCMVAGLEEISKVFHRVHVHIKLRVSDGSFVQKGCVVAVVSGKVRSILKVERVALNILGRMSGIATETNSLVKLSRTINPEVTIAATRKTTPGFRSYEKKAVVLGGGEPHRQGLYDVFMIKDNHLKIFGSVEIALKKVMCKKKGKTIEIEVENEKDALTAAQYPINVIMLDNFPPQNAKKVTHKIRKINPKILIEVSGGITRKNITKYAGFADRISLGYITHSVQNKDFSLEIKKP